MMKSLRYQSLQLRKQLLLGIIVALGMLFSSLLYPISDIGIEILVYFCIAVGCYFIFLSAGTGGLTMALTFGATRKGWYWAMLITKAVFSLVLAIVLYLASIPFSAGTNFSAGTPWQMLPSYFMFTLFFASFALFLGLATKKIPIFWSVIFNIMFWMIVGAILSVKISVYITGNSAPLLEGIGWLLVLFVAAVGLDTISWRMAAKAAVGG